eukprot:9027394-Pyramimonas_sp.AAC.1
MEGGGGGGGGGAKVQWRTSVRSLANARLQWGHALRARAAGGGEARLSRQVRDATRADRRRGRRKGTRAARAHRPT